MREGYSRGYEGMGALRLRFEEFGSKHEKRTRLSEELWRAAIPSRPLRCSQWRCDSSHGRLGRTT
jgi:hypothetical protein